MKSSAVVSKIPDKKKTILIAKVTHKHTHTRTPSIYLGSLTINDSLKQMNEVQLAESHKH